MAAHNRLNGAPYTCRNSRFWTDITKGHCHGHGQVRGSVFDSPLVEGDGYSLWLEYVEDRDGGWEPFWLMWYDSEGNPTIPMSGVFDQSQMRAMVEKLASFIEIA